MQASSNNIQDTARADLIVHPSNIKINETPLYSNIPGSQSLPQTIAYSQYIPIYPQNTVPATGNSLSSSMPQSGSELTNPIVISQIPYMSMVNVGDGSQLPCNYSTNGEVMLSRSAPAAPLRYDMNSYYAIQPQIAQFNNQQQPFIPVQYIQYTTTATLPQTTPVIRQQPLSRPIDIPPLPPSTSSNNPSKMEEEDENDDDGDDKLDKSKFNNNPIEDDEDSLYGLNILSDMAEQFSNITDDSQLDVNQQQNQSQQQLQQHIEQNLNNLPKIQPAIPPKKREARRVYETCSTCNQHKPLTEFTLKRTGEHTHTCKVCSERKKNYYKRNIVKKHKRDEY